MKLRYFSFVIAGLTSMLAAGQNNIIEEVAWVVGDQPIYKSQIEEMYQQMLYERMPIDGDPYCIIPEQLAIEKLYLHQADMDTVEVQESMVQQQVDARINMMINNIGSKEKVEEYFRKPLPDIRSQFAEAIRDNARISQVQSSLTSDIKITPSDVRRYFNSLPDDSIPMVPLQVEVQILTLNPEIPRQEIDDVKARLRDFTEQINNGEKDFSTLAILYSQHTPSAMRGGELGFSGRSQFEPEFAAVAFNLNDPKKVSKIVETQYGFHIIQLIEKRGDRINCRQILLQPRVSDADLTKAIHRLDSLKADIVEGKFTFEEATPYLSQDKDTKNNRGIMINSETEDTRFEMSQLPAEVAKVVNGLQQGEISDAFIMRDPKRNREIVALVKLTRRIPAHKANLSEDYQLIKNMYEESRRSEILKEWLEKKIKETYVRIEDGWDNCEFHHSGWLKLKNK